MKNAFSLIELIFVVVLIGVISGIGFYMSRPDTPRQDAQYTLLKLKEARYRAIGYDALMPEHCVTLTPDSLSDNEPPKHTIKSTLTLSTALPGDTVCFDALGRPHKGNSIDLTTLLPSSMDINVSDSSGKSTVIRLYNGTGYAIIPCNN